MKAQYASLSAVQEDEGGILSVNSAGNGGTMYSYEDGAWSAENFSYSDGSITSEEWTGKLVSVGGTYYVWGEAGTGDTMEAALAFAYDNHYTISDGKMTFKSGEVFATYTYSSTDGLVTVTPGSHDPDYFYYSNKTLYVSVRLYDYSGSLPSVN